MDSALSASTAEVEFSDFDVMERIAVADIPERLHPEDPRLDEFLRGVGKLFQSGSGKEQIIYLPARVSLPLLAARIRAALPGGSFSILEWQGVRRFLLLLLSLALIAAVILGEEKNRFLHAVFALPWLGLFLSGGPGGFAAGFLLYGALMYLLDEALPLFDHFLYDHGSRFPVTPAVKERSVYAGAVAVGAVVLLSLSDGLFASRSFLLGLGATTALTAAMALFRMERQWGREHRLFLPLPILPRPWRGGAALGRDRASVLILILLLAVPLVYRATGTGESHLVPRPYRISGLGRMSRESLRELWLTNRGEKLPDFSDYLCHRAFQQGFFHGYPQEFPDEGAAVTLSRYAPEGAGISRRDEVIAKYDEAWYKNELKVAKESALGALLYAQGVRGVSLETTGGVAVTSAYIAGYGLAVVLGYLPLLFLSRRAGPGSPRLFGSIMARRKRQEA